MSANVSDTAGTEVPQTATTEAGAVALALISRIEAVTRSQLLADDIDTFPPAPGLE